MLYVVLRHRGTRLVLDILLSIHALTPTPLLQDLAQQTRAERRRARARQSGGGAGKGEGGQGEGEGGEGRREEEEVIDFAWLTSRAL